MTPHAAMRRGLRRFLVRRLPLMLASWSMAGMGGWLLAWHHPERGWMLVAAGVVAAFLSLWWE